MVSSFTIFAPALMGRGAYEQIAIKCRERNIESVAIVSDAVIEKIGLVNKVETSLHDVGIKTIKFTESIPNPTDTSIEQAYQLLKEQGEFGAIVGVGGGSSLDTAKGVNVLINNPLPLSDYFLGGKPTNAGIPIFLIPTTSGSGSESSYSCIITDEKNNRKTTIRSLNCCLATFAVVDPEFTLTMPRSLTIASGIDAFSHAAESLTVNKPNPISRIFAMEALQLLVKYLPIAVEDGSNVEARTMVGRAAMLSGMAFANTMCHIGHSIAHSLGAQLHLEHGMCLSAVLPNAIYYVADAVPEQVRDVGESLGLTFDCFATPEELGRRTAEFIQEFLAKLGAPSLMELGVTREQVISVYPLVSKDGCFPFLPKEMTDDDIIQMLGHVYDRSLYYKPL